MKINAYAKINLALKVENKRQDGFHNLKTIMVPISLSDSIKIKRSKTFTIKSNIFIKENILVKTFELFKKEFQIIQNIKIIVQKRIPIGAGLGGGSSDSSALLLLLNKYFKVNAPIAKLKQLALELGSDNPFFLANRPSFVSGRGETLEFIPRFEKRKIYLLNLKIFVSTKNVFDNLVLTNSFDFDNLKSLYKSDFHRFLKEARNDLLASALRCYPSLNDIYERVNKIADFQLTGTGSTLFSFSLSKQALKALKKIKMIKIIKTEALL